MEVEHRKDYVLTEGGCLLLVTLPVCSSVYCQAAFVSDAVAWISLFYAWKPHLASLYIRVIAFRYSCSFLELSCIRFTDVWYMHRNKCVYIEYAIH